jgi:UDP-3-O-[3-hydroxymyristoyl] glucosamine N-acyltransferase
VVRTLRELADLVGGKVYGPPDQPIAAAKPITDAGPEDITFLESEKHARALQSSKAGAFVASEALGEKLAAEGKAVITAADPLQAFAALYRAFHPAPPAPPAEVSPLAYVHPTARLGPGCTILPFAYIGASVTLGPRAFVGSGASIGEGCVVGEDVTLNANCVLYPGTVLGDRVIIHAGAVLGADGFGYRFDQGRHVKVPHLGQVEVGDDVEVGANTTIDRGTFGPTRIAHGTKIDNLVQIGHNCAIGRHNLIVSQVGIAGSCTTGSYVVLAGQVGIADHVHIGDGAQVGAGSGVPNDVPAKERVVGYPAQPERLAKRAALCLPRIPDLIQDVKKLKRKCGLDEEEEKAA